MSKIKSAKEIKYILGGKYRASYAPLIEAVACGKIAGIVLLNGEKESIIETAKVLAGKNVLVLNLSENEINESEVSVDFAGNGLSEICEAVCVLPVINMEESAAIELLEGVKLESGLKDLPVIWNYAGDIFKAIESKRESLGLNNGNNNQQTERKLIDMKERRAH